MSLILTARRFWYCNSGVTAIEFAIIGPIFIYLLMAIMEYGLILFADATLESSINVAAREAKTGSFYSCPHATSLSQYVTNITKSLAGGILLNTTPTNPTITETVVPITDSLSLHNYTVTYNWMPFTPFINSFFGGNGINLTSSILLNDEIIPPNPLLNGGLPNPNATISVTHTLGQKSATTFVPSYFGCN